MVPHYARKVLANCALEKGRLDGSARKGLGEETSADRRDFESELAERHRGSETERRGSKQHGHRLEQSVDELTTTA
jgi:hypothetical protein